MYYCFRATFTETFEEFKVCDKIHHRDSNEVTKVVYQCVDLFYLVKVEKFYSVARFSSRRQCLLRSLNAVKNLIIGK